MTTPFDSYRLGDLTLRNRIIKAATFEGMAPGSTVSPALVKHHEALAAGGVGMTTLAYCSVAADGRTFADQLYMRPELVGPLKGLTDAVHRHGAAAAVQLGHCGSFSNNHDLQARRPKGPSRTFNKLGALSGRPIADALTEPEINELVEAFTRAALLARESGFDAVELHLGHGYLLSQFLSPDSNQRTDQFGGSLENRARFPLKVVESVRAALPAGFPVVAKVNLRDGHAGGLELDESIQIAQWLEARGVNALVLSGGYVSKDAFYLFRGERPLKQMIEVEKSWAQKVALALFGPAVIKAHPFEPMYFLPLASQVRKAVKLPLALLGGLTALEHLQRACDEGFELMAMARALVHDPAFISKLQSGALKASACVPCNRCVAEMDRPTGVRCVLVPPS